MKKTVVAVLSLMLVCGTATILTDSCYATTVNEIQMVQNGKDVVLTLSDMDPESSVTWDLDDGRVINDSSIKTSFKSGFYLITAIIDTPGKEIVKLERHVAVYDDAPSGSVITANLNEEFRYGIYTSTTPTLSMFDTNGQNVSWLTYDEDYRVLTGVPKKTGIYHVYFNDLYWTINVIDTGQSYPPAVKFNANIEDNNITATPSTSDDFARYSWSLRTFEGDLKSAYEGKNLNITANPGYYTLTLQQIGITGSASYSQVVFIDGDIETSTENDEKSYGLALTLGIITAILLIVALMTYSPLIASSSVLSAIATILSVII